METEQFEQLVAEEFERAIPEQFRPHIKNVAFLVEDEPSAEVREREGLRDGETLLGYYHGIPMPLRGNWYGMGTTLPDTITLYRLPILEEAEDELRRQTDGRARSGERRPVLPLSSRPAGFEELVRKVIRETIWHEVAHHFGMDEGTVSERERRRHSED
jgi:predicted Zn-dependent protease with MMP-like domain